MLGNFAQQILTLFRHRGFEVSVSAYAGQPVISIFDPVRNAETCLGVSPSNERAVLTRLVREFGLADAVDALDPSFSGTPQPEPLPV